MSSRNPPAGPPAPRRNSAGHWTTRSRRFSAASRSSPLFASTTAAGTNSDAPLSPDASTTPRPAMPAMRARLERRCNIAVDERYSSHEVLLNLDMFGGDIRPGMLVAVTGLVSDKSSGNHAAIYGKGVASEQAGRQSPGASPPTIVQQPPVEQSTEKKYVFIAKDMPRDTKTRFPTVEIVVVKHIADAFGFKRGSPVILTLVDSTNPAIEASHVELSFKDQYLSRSDMWRMTVDELMQRTVYRGQSVLFMGTIKAQVTAIFVAGRKVHSAFFVRRTRPILRSESARYVLLIQMAREMWDFDSEGSGEIMFNKVVNGFLPTLFKKWALLKAKHLVSIVLFARVEYDTGLTAQLANVSLGRGYYTGILPTGSRRPYKDFYRVVVSEMASMEWTTILYQLKKEFNFFRRDVLLYHQRAGSGFATCGDKDADGRDLSSNRVKAEFSQAMYGSFLEAINLASAQYAHDYIDRDLMRTGISIVVLSPGSGVYEVDYDALRRTTESLVSNGIAIDLICMSKLPLHSAPLFKFRNPQFLTAHHPSLTSTLPRLARGSHDSTPSQATPLVGSYQSVTGSISPTKGPPIPMRHPDLNAAAPDEWCYVIPQWLHVAYWTGDSEDALDYQGIAGAVLGNVCNGADGEFAMRCRMYDLQMRSVLETNEIETAPLQADPVFPRAAVESRTDSSSRTNPRRVTENPHSHVHGMARFPDWVSKLGEKALWRQLRDFDDARARLPVVRRHALPPSRHARDAGDDQKRGGGGDDCAAMYSTSFSERRCRKLSMNASYGIAEAGRHEGLGPRPQPTVSLSTSTLPTVPRTLAPPKPLKFMRQISLTHRGFGIAAPKAAVAEVQVESVNAAKVAAKASPLENKLLMAPARPSSQASMASTPSEALNIAQHAMRARSFDVGAQDPMSSTPSIPIIKRTPTPLEPPPPCVSSSIGSERTGSMGAERDDRDIRYSNVLRAEDAHKVFTNKLRSGGVQELPSTLSPQSAMTPWLTAVNPSNPDSHKLTDTLLYSRWQHVFPRTTDMSIMKWKALCCPAAVPLTTEYFPSRHQLDTEFQRHPYNIDPTEADDYDEVRTREECLRELIGLRLSQGFQVVIGPSVARAFGQRHLKVADIFSRDQVLEDGASVFMSLGNTVHQLSCVNGTEIEVNIFVRKTVESSSFTLPFGGTPLYKPAIRTLLDESYQAMEFDIATAKQDRNWNTLDTYLAGQHDDMNEALRFWRARFVLVPMEPRQSSLGFGNQGVDSPEETRIEGIKKLTQGWQKHRYIAPSERRFQTAAPRRKSNNPLDIVYKTDDPSIVMAAELDPLLEDIRPKKGTLVSGRYRFSKSGLNMPELAEAVQQPVDHGGVRMQNRRWHFKLHYNCFIGSDMTTWLLDNVEDLETREEAETLGNLLMATTEDEKARETKEKDGQIREKDTKEAKKDKGLFMHVARRHPFRDGNYFYQILPEYSRGQNAGWFATKRRETSVPSTPLAENVMRESPRPMLSARPTTVDEELAPTSGTTTPTGPGAAALQVGGCKKRTEILLSKMIKYDVDHRRRSYRPERINLHYDRLHNPDNCYHIRIDWMNVTAKLIEDAVESWAREALAYGMRLVEVPIKEASVINETNAFVRPHTVKLAAQPPERQPMTYWDQYSLAPQPAPARHFYQQAILKRFDFVLDMEAASNFPPNINVFYSWGKPDFRCSQYIHRSGVLLAQITDDGNFIMLENRLYSNRAQAAREKELRGAAEQQQQQQQQQQHQQQQQQQQQQQPQSQTSPPAPPPAPGPLERPAARSISSSAYGLSDPTPINSPLAKPMFYTPSPAMGAKDHPSVHAHSNLPSLPTLPALPPPLASSSAPTVPSTADGPASSANFSFSFAPGQPRLCTAAALGVTSMSEYIKDEVEAFCSDAGALDEFYREIYEGNITGPGSGAGATGNGFSQHSVGGSIYHRNASGPATPMMSSNAAVGFGVPEASIPTLGLPPGVIDCAPARL